MSSIRTDLSALDTNIYLLATRRVAGFESTSKLLSRINELRVVLPTQVLSEINNEALPFEQRTIFAHFKRAKDFIQGIGETKRDLIAHYKARGAKKGDAVICAQLHAAGVKWFVSENRHFLTEISDLPFTVLTAAEALSLLEE